MESVMSIKKVEHISMLHSIKDSEMYSNAKKSIIDALKELDTNYIRAKSIRDSLSDLKWEAEGLL